MKKLPLRLISILIYLFVRVMHFTYRYRYSDQSEIRKLKGENKNYVFSIYHQNLFPGILAQTGNKHVVIVSKSKDAEPVAFTCRRFGHVVCRGSSKRGSVDKNGSVAKEEMIECLKAGIPGAVTVDGPKGPANKVKPGIIDMARKSGAYIIPYIVSPQSYWQFNSWDFFRLPKPFSQIYISYGEPIKIDPECSDYEKEMKSLEEQMEKTLLASIRSRV